MAGIISMVGIISVAVQAFFVIDREFRFVNGGILSYIQYW